MTDLLRRNKGLTGIVTAVFGLLVVLTVLNRDSAYPTSDLHPENPDPNGARAVAQVLADQGVTVEVAHDEAELLRSNLGPDVTVVVTSMENLSATTISTLLDRSGSIGALVMSSPPAGLLESIDDDLELGESRISGERDADCGDALLDGLTVVVRPSPAYRDRGSSARCFRGDDGGADSLVLRLDGSPATYVVGGSDLFTNSSILEADNAAVGMRLLGQHGHLVWYVPDPDDVPAGEGAALSSLLPRWLMPSLLLVAGACVALVLWRGRRLGPVVVEPLPVVVRNSEAVEARGRLYRRSGDRDHTARVLRAAAVDRLADHIALSRTGSHDRLVHDVALLTGRPAEEVAALLAHQPVTSDRDLLALANALAALDKEVGQA